MMDDLWPKFLAGCEANNLDKKKVEKVWKDWEAFASYAFNKSHSTCYAFVAFQTAYLKANYPAEYMASVLGHNMNDLKKVSFFMDECKRMKIPVLGPDVNESSKKFTVNAKGEIRFALSAIKGVGDAAVENIIETRQEAGAYTSFFDMCRKVNLRTVNKKSIESLALAGGFDELDDFHRAQYFNVTASDSSNLIEKGTRYGNSVQNSEMTASNSLFGDSAEMDIAEPKIAECEEWSLIEKLNKEKDVVGIYLSGHPLDIYKMEMNSYASANTQNIKDRPNVVSKFGGIISSSNTRFSKKGSKFCIFSIEDYDGSLEIFLFGNDYLDFSKYVEDVGNMILVTGRYQPRKYNKDEYEFKVTSMELLDEVKEKYTNSVLLELESTHLTTSKVQDLVATIKEYPGTYNLEVQLRDITEEGMRLRSPMTSRTIKIDPTQEFIEQVEEVSGGVVKLR